MFLDNFKSSGNFTNTSEEMSKMSQLEILSNTYSSAASMGCKTRESNCSEFVGVSNGHLFVHN